MILPLSFRLFFSAFIVSASTLSADSRGLAIYQKHCLECHGKDGSGDEDTDPFEGSRSLAWLTGKIERTMPEDHEDRVVGADARAVAEYVHREFYQAAQTEPVRAELAHLTVRQYRASVTDLIAIFRNDYWHSVSEDFGLEAKYFGSRRYNAKKENEGRDQFVRIDPRIQFDFGTGTPNLPKGKEFPPEEFSILWGGGLVPPATGTYEFVIRTRNGVNLWVNNRAANDQTGQLIDGYVAPSNEVRELRASLYLTADRVYPIELRFFKYKEDKASVELLWKPPHGVLEVIPKRALRKHGRWESFVSDTPFPPDDRSFGYERGTNMSEAWLDAVVASATQAANYLVDHKRHYANISSKDPVEKQVAQVKRFAGEFLQYALRRPMNQEQRSKLIHPHFSAAGDDYLEGLKRTILFGLTSPEFLYPEATLPNDRHATAERLALALWDSIPDKKLRKLAATNKLRTQEEARKQAEWMLWDRRTQAKIREFFGEWLELERAEELAKDTKRYPEFRPEVLADLQTSLDLFLHESVWGKEHASFPNFVLSEDVFLNRRLGELYGKPVKGNQFQRVRLPGQGRSGVLTHPLVLSGLAYHDNTSPIHRGVFLTRNVLGQTLNPPPDANLFEDGKFDPKLTMREKVTELTKAKTCMGCHVTINPLGFAMENYDAIGRWRTKEQGKPINPRGRVTTHDGKSLQLKGARDIGKFVAHDPAAQRAFVGKVFEHLTKQPPEAFGRDTEERLRRTWADQGFWIPALFMEIAVTYAMRST
ncbi:MAG: DUF1592 domain-containing protein [Verrucomicrobiota bacterium]